MFILSNIFGSLETLGQPQSFWLINWCVVIAGCCVAAAIDVYCRRIPNKLTGPLLFIGLLWWMFHGEFGSSLSGMAVAGLPFFVLWMMGGGGAGDAKMMLALGAWLGTDRAFFCAIAVGIAGGILSLIYAGAHRRLKFALANTGWMILSMPFVVLGPGRLLDRQKLMPASADKPLKTPYSLAMLAGTCALAGWMWVCSA
jgi:Flp pilus assembly protein protease CpaA